MSKMMDKFKDVMNKGVKASKEIITSAKDQAKDISDKGVLQFEIHNLKKKVEDIEREVGKTIYNLLSSGDAQSVSLKTPTLKPLFSELDDISNTLKIKEDELQEMKKRSSEEDDKPEEPETTVDKEGN